MEKRIILDLPGIGAVQPKDIILVGEAESAENYPRSGNDDWHVFIHLSYVVACDMASESFWQRCAFASKEKAEAFRTKILNNFEVIKIDR